MPGTSFVPSVPKSRRTYCQVLIARQVNTACARSNPNPLMPVRPPWMRPKFLLDSALMSATAITNAMGNIASPQARSQQPDQLESPQDCSPTARRSRSRSRPVGASNPGVPTGKTSRSAFGETRTSPGNLHQRGLREQTKYEVLTVLSKTNRQSASAPEMISISSLVMLA
jgi:hypothetical protein